MEQIKLKVGCWMVFWILASFFGVINQCNSFQVKEKNASKCVWSTNSETGWEHDISEE